MLLSNVGVVVVGQAESRSEVVARRGERVRE